MSCHLRNLAYFVLGFAAICLAGLASAGVPFYVDDGQVYSNGQLQRSVNGSPGTVFTASNCANDPYLNVSRQGGFTITGANGVAANGPLVESGKIPRSAVASAVVKVLRGGGIYGAAASVAGAYLIEKGWEYAQDHWLMPDTSSDYPGLFNGNWGASVNCNCTLSTILSRMGSEGVISYTFNQYGVPGSVKYKCDGGYTCNVGLSKVGESQKSAANDADLLAQADPAVCSNPSSVLADLAKNGVSVDSEAQPFTYSSPEPIATPKIVTESSTKTNPDGSTTTEEVQRWQEYKPDPSPVPYGNPVPVQVENKSTTTTTTYNIDNSTSTTTTTKTENVSKGGVPTTPKEEQKSECELNPKALGCQELGEAPTAPDLGTDSVTLSFSWTPFSMPAQCPAPVQVNTHLIPSFTIPYDSLCNAADIARPLIIAGAFLMALGIIFTGRSD